MFVRIACCFFITLHILAASAFSKDNPLAGAAERIEKHRTTKNWEELVVQPKKDYDAALRHQEQFLKKQQQGGVIGPDGHVYYPPQ